MWHLGTGKRRANKECAWQCHGSFTENIRILIVLTPYLPHGPKKSSNNNITDEEQQTYESVNYGAVNCGALTKPTIYPRLMLRSDTY